MNTGRWTVRQEFLDRLGPLWEPRYIVRDPLGGLRAVYGADCAGHQRAMRYAADLARRIERLVLQG